MLGDPDTEAQSEESPYSQHLAMEGELPTVEAMEETMNKWKDELAAREADHVGESKQRRPTFMGADFICSSVPKPKA